MFLLIHENPLVWCISHQSHLKNHHRNFLLEPWRGKGKFGNNSTCRGYITSITHLFSAIYNGYIYVTTLFTTGNLRGPPCSHKCHTNFRRAFWRYNVPAGAKYKAGVRSSGGLGNSGLSERFEGCHFFEVFETSHVDKLIGNTTFWLKDLRIVAISPLMWVFGWEMVIVILNPIILYMHAYVQFNGR